MQLHTTTIQLRMHSENQRILISYTKKNKLTYKINSVMFKQAACLVLRA